MRARAPNFAKKLFNVQGFVDEHRALILRHALAFTSANGEKIPPEDVAREIELILVQLGSVKELTPAAIEAPDAYLRAIAKHATGRAKRRRTLIEQLAAGDDLDALSADLAALDADLPPLPAPAPRDAKDARTLLDRVKRALPPRDALVFALLFEDGEAIEDVASTIGMAIEEVATARERILEAAATNGVPSDPDARERAS